MGGIHSFNAGFLTYTLESEVIIRSKCELILTLGAVWSPSVDVVIKHGEEDCVVVVLAERLHVLTVRPVGKERLASYVRQKCSLNVCTPAYLGAINV